MPSQEYITHFNESILVAILTCMFLASVVCVVITRLLTKLAMVRVLKIDDYLVILATLLAGAQSAAVLVQCSNGLGKQVDTLSERQISIFLKFEYAANVLFVASLLFAKLSVGAAIKTLLMPPERRKMVLAVEVCVLLWAVSAIMTFLFQCKLPTPWDHVKGACINRIAFWTYFSVGNIVTDLGLIAVMAHAVRHIQLSWSKMAMVVVVFGSRILVVPAVICQVYFSYKGFHSGDITFGTWKSTVLIQVVQCLSLTTACVPYFKKFFESLISGGLDMRQRNAADRSGYYLSDASGQSTGQQMVDVSKSGRDSTTAAAAKQGVPGMRRAKRARRSWCTRRGTCTKEEGKSRALDAFCVSTFVGRSAMRALIDILLPPLLQAS
ncbi:hypothetical protein PT974_11162 [Cladobotryum mycophilum]|uniref:Rhodopsin domain-containing protein n=1 Tax=Cladobotryum mycophilum TaxID=491253 RepID=A0ABR0S5E8_9HYPO